LTNFGPSGEIVFNRTYARPMPDGRKETWPETVRRVVAGNIALVEREPERDEVETLHQLMDDFSVIPAGRHLWASGVQGRQYLFNCWVSGWGDKISDHFKFTFLRLMEGGGVGASYASKNTERYGPPKHAIEVHIVCDEDHPDYQAMMDADVLSHTYSPDYLGAFMEIEDSREGWAEALSDLLEAAWDSEARSVRVYDVTRVRCAGARLKTFGGSASGPLPLAKMLHGISDVLDELAPIMEFEDYPYAGTGALPMDPISAMEIDHEIAMCVVSGGVRRSARMAVLPWDDPWIHEFITCKTETGSHWTTNISVAVDDEFFEELEFTYSKANKVLEAVSEGMLTNGEPGLWNYSLSQVGEVGEVVCTNPCGEIALSEWEACNLGHINLDKMLGHDGKWDYRKADKAARHITRFLIRATFGDINDPRSRAIMDKNRRIGVGLLGVQAALAKQGIRYSEAPSNPEFEDFLCFLRESVRDEARNYSFLLRIPEPVKVTTLAPTGSVAKLPGTTEGGQSIYSRYFLRRIRFSTVSASEMEQLAELEAEGFETEVDQYAANTRIAIIPTKERLVQEVEDLGFDPDIVEQADEISLHDMLSFQRILQECWADNAVSYTANVPEGVLSVNTLKTLLKHHLPHLKGTTIMPDGTRPQAPYERISKEDYALYALQTIADSTDEECITGCPVR
jgi:ribonucleoside-triphosphate reductase